jgi:lambda family phage minor tail protein L
MSFDFEHPPIIELFNIDLSILGEGIYYFHPYETDLPVKFLGQTYSPLPIEADGFEITNKGLPTPKITVSNVFGLMGNLIDNFDGLQGAKLIRTKLQSHAPPHDYNNNDVVGNPDIYIIDRPTSESKLKVTFELRSIFDLSTLKLPRRIIFQNRCSAVYKSSECGYIGSLPTCDRNIDDCLIHFQQMTGESNPELNFSGFVGVDRYPS